MKSLPSAEIREKFLEFFHQRGHTIVASSSLIPGSDPTLLFPNSGMVQFKDTFVGLEKRPYNRATTAQKCLRVSGKHNDLEEVGPSPRHHTFFEMLGNFSFGDYFKRDAIQFAWDLLTKEFGLPVERLWFSVFEGNEQAPADEEAVQLWIAAGADPDRVLRFGAKENFWEMGTTGPCGPCSEIHYYQGDNPDQQVASGVNSDDPMYMEIWNLVFMQYFRDNTGTLTPLPKPSIDTGMGFERIVSVIQGVTNNYDTDLFTPIIQREIALLGTDEEHYRANFAPYRAVADHSRSVAFLIADGVLPGNTGRSYVLRRLLRRAVYQGRSIGFERPFLADVVATVIEQMGNAYPELHKRRAFILETVDIEERQFLRTLSSGLVRLNSAIDQVKASNGNVLSGEYAFTLKDTHGFPLDLTQKIAADHGLTVDEEEYTQALQQQRTRSRDTAKFKRGADADVWADQEMPATNFVGYTQLSSESTVLALIFASDAVSRASAGQQVQLVLDTTPFYAESGGQVGDTGVITGPNGAIRVSDTQRPLPGVIVHYGTVEHGEVNRGEQVVALVDVARRDDVERNHTATHLLHRALRDTLGEHAAQAGSLVAPDRLRFDFNHTRAVTPEQLRAIEAHINAWVRRDTPVSWDTFAYQDALERGAMALFGEKYGDRVRMVTVGCDEPGARSQEPGARSQEPKGNSNIELDLQSEQAEVVLTTDTEPLTPSMCSRELCGGTHVARTGELGFVRIVSESGVAAGIRRIEAVTGCGAEALVDAQAMTLREIAARLGVQPARALERIDSIIAELKQHQHELDTLRGQATRGSLEGLLAQVQHANDVDYLAVRVAAPDATQLREMGDWLRDKLGSGAIVLGTVLNEKPQLLAIVTPDLLAKGYHAGNLVKTLAPIVGGGGGGRPEMAQAGGRDADKLDEALAQVGRVLSAQAKK